MKKVFLFILILAIVIQSTNAQITISEVYYNPVSSENTGEAIVLYNDFDYDVDISGWVLATKASNSDATLPPNTIISSGGNLLIADSEFSLNKENSSWPEPDYEEALTLSNTDGGIALMNGTNIVDAVGWGDATNIDSSLFETTTTNGVDEGFSLLRIQDTNNNLDDFIVSNPFEQFFNPLEIKIEVQANITSVQAEIISFEIIEDDNLTIDGIQIHPRAGKERDFQVKMLVYLPEEENIIVKAFLDGEEFILETNDFNKTNKSFFGQVSMDYFDLAGKYNIIGKIVSSDYEKEENISFEYFELSSFEANQKISFEANAGTNASSLINIRNLGNTELQIKIRGESLSNSEDSISASKLFFSDNDFETSKKLSGKYQSLFSLGVRENKDINLLIEADTSLSTGEYKGNIFLKAST